MNQTHETKESVELDNYLKFAQIDEKIEDPLEWWLSKQTEYPYLFRIVPKYLCLVATSVPSERVFSKAEEIVSKKRSQLSWEHVDGQIFLNKNFKFL